MEKNQANVEEVISNVLSIEMTDSSVLTPEHLAEIAKQYLETDKVTLPNDVLKEMATYENEPVPPGVEALSRSLWQEFERYTPSVKKKFEETAETIIVKVLGLEFETYLDQHGVQRFKTDTVVSQLFHAKLFDLDRLSFEFETGKISTEDFLTFYAKSGYSVSGLASLSYFVHLTFENPLW